MTTHQTTRRRAVQLVLAVLATTTVSLLSGCQAELFDRAEASGPPPTSPATPIGGSPLGPPATPIGPLEVNDQPAHFRRTGLEWSEPVGGFTYGPRGTGYEVRLRRLEGRRWLVYDPQTDGPCYVDGGDLIVPPAVERQMALLSKPAQKSVVTLVAQPEAYQQAGPALSSLASWLEQTAHPDYRYTFLWFAPLSAGKAAEIIPPLTVPAPPNPPRLAVPTPLPPSCTFDPDCHDRFEAEEAQRNATQAAYQQDLLTYQQRLQRQLAAAVQGLSGATTAPRPPEADIQDAITRAALLLSNAPGERWLLIAAPLDAPPQLTQLPSIEGLQIRFVFPQASSVTFRQLEADWMNWAAVRHADLRVVDASADLARELV